MSVDQTVEAAMEAQFWDIFSVGVGVSQNMSTIMMIIVSMVTQVSESTSYDWGHTSSQTKSKQVRPMMIIV